MATPKKSAPKAPAAPVAPAVSAPAPVEPVTAAELNLAVDAPVADEAAITAISTPELPGQIPGAAPAPDPAPVPGSSVAIPPAPAPAPGDVDAAGTPFDPALHDAKREKNAEGFWKKKRGRKGGAPAPASGDPAEPASRVGIPDAPGQQMLPGMEGIAAPDRFDIAAEMYCQLAYGIGGAIFRAAEEWRPDTPEEHNNLKRAVAAYLRFKQTEDLPPGMALAVAVGSFAVPRLMRPNTKAALGSYIQSAKKLLKRESPAEIPAVPPVNRETPENGYPPSNE